MPPLTPHNRFLLGSLSLGHMTNNWVDWFNNRRILEPIGNIPPAEYELMYYQQLEESSEAA